MNILMIDTSGPACGVAIMRDGRLIYEAELVNKQTHSQRVMPMADRIFSSIARIFFLSSSSMWS